MNDMKKYSIIALFFSIIMIALCACGTQSFSATYTGPDFNELSATKTWNLSYAELFSVTEYGDYTYIETDQNANYMIVPDGCEVPRNLPDNTSVLIKPFDEVYLVSSSVMDMLCEIGAEEQVTMTGTKKDGWYIESPVERMDEGTLLYAGKYNEPDYELILDKGCNLAIENTMIWHNPETKEKLEELGIPVFVEFSNYESHPLGRLEWIKLYGILFDKEEEACCFFDSQVANISDYIDAQDTGKTIAFFYITANGAISVKKSGDAVAKMIQMSGGNYLPVTKDEDENALSTVNMQFEEFYAQCKDADILIYNSTINDDVDCIDDIIAKNELFKDFKAVKNGNVYESGANFYQKSTGVCHLIEDLSIVINEGNENNLYFLRHLE